MDSLIGSVDSQAILIIAAIAVAILAAMLLIRILKASASLVLAIGAIVLVLQYVFGISPSQLWAEIGNLPQAVSQFVKSFDIQSLTSIFSD